MRFPFLGKFAALAAVIAALLIALGAVSGLVRERQQRQAEAEDSVAASLAGSQRVLGPLLVRQCVETWTHVDGEGKERKTVTERRVVVQRIAPHRLDVATRTALEPRHRGLFQVAGFVDRSTIAADWTETAPPMPDPSLPDARLVCDAPTVAVALGDARGVRAAELRVGGATLPLAPGSTLPANERGIHATLDERMLHDGRLHVDLTLALAGTGDIAWAPIADETRVAAASGWPHPSFAGRFLPVVTDVSPQGFHAVWQVSALASSAQQAVQAGVPACALHDGADAPTPAGTPACIDSFGVRFVDPVDGYVLNDRALKYGILFIGLTFVAVGATEVTRRLRVHPIQYLLVGAALTVFFLLLLSLSEHLGFGTAYLVAATACTALLTYYGRHVLHGMRAGLAFGAGIATLYGALYALLQLEQTALVLGSTLLFVVLAAVMVATRKLDWYALAAQLNRGEPAPAAGT